MTSMTIESNSEMPEVDDIENSSLPVLQCSYQKDYLCATIGSRNCSTETPGTSVLSEPVQKSTRYPFNP